MPGLSGFPVQAAANWGEQSSTTGSTSPRRSRRKSLGPFRVTGFCLRPPEPKVTGSSPVGDIHKASIYKRLRLFLCASSVSNSVRPRCVSNSHRFADSTVHCTPPISLGRECSRLSLDDEQCLKSRTLASIRNSIGYSVALRSASDRPCRPTWGGITRPPRRPAYPAPESAFRDAPRCSRPGPRTFQARRPAARPRLRPPRSEEPGEAGFGECVWRAPLHAAGRWNRPWRNSAMVFPFSDSPVRDRGLGRDALARPFVAPAQNSTGFPAARRA